MCEKAAASAVQLLPMEAQDESPSRPDRLLLDRGEITTTSASGGGGEIQVTVEDFIDLRNGAVTTSVAGGADPTAGSILIDPKTLVIDGSTIKADAGAGSGGNIEIIADSVLVPEGNLEGLIARRRLSASGAGRSVVRSRSARPRGRHLGRPGRVGRGAARHRIAATPALQFPAGHRDQQLYGRGSRRPPANADGPLASDYAPQQNPAVGSRPRSTSPKQCPPWSQSSSHAAGPPEPSPRGLHEAATCASPCAVT